MQILVVGATGATGRLLVEQLLSRGHNVTAIVRSPDKLPDALRNHTHLTTIASTVLDLGHDELNTCVGHCDAVASCLGHTLSAKGIWGPPYRLVTNTVRKLCQAIKAQGANRATKVVLMNTTGNRNRDLHEPISPAQHCVLALLRLLIPPHADNEKAADYLRTTFGQNHSLVEWAAVRPDTLIDEPHVTDYDIHPSPTRSAIFDAGKTSRINVAHFMADLITCDATWQQWQGKMPVIYNRQSSSST